MADIAAVGGAAVRTAPARATRQVLLVALVQVLAMAPWFVGSAASAGLEVAWSMSVGQLSWLTSAVQVGFVLSAVALAWWSVPDRVAPARLIGVAAVVAAVTTILPAVLSLGFAPVLVSRVLTGAALAGVYPPGIRVATSWTVRRRGTAVAVLVGALTLGSAVPRLAPVEPPIGWQALFVTAGAAALLAAVLASRLELGPHARSSRGFDPGAVGAVFREPAQRRPTLGYLGHMWELYAFWTWLPAFLVASGLGGNTWPGPAFWIAGVAGLAGCLVAGTLADRWGKVRVASVALGTSGVCCLLSPVVALLPAGLGLLFLVVWGAAVVADSPLYSALLGDAAPADQVGTALTVQTATGFALTVASIRLLPVVAGAVTWRWAFVALALGPVVGLWALWRGGRQIPGRLTRGS